MKLHHQICHAQQQPTSASPPMVTYHHDAHLRIEAYYCYNLGTRFTYSLRGSSKLVTLSPPPLPIPCKLAGRFKQGILSGFVHQILEAWINSKNPHIDSPWLYCHQLIFWPLVEVLEILLAYCTDTTNSSCNAWHRAVKWRYFWGVTHNK